MSLELSINADYTTLFSTKYDTARSYAAIFQQSVSRVRFPGHGANMSRPFQHRTSSTIPRNLQSIGPVLSAHAKQAAYQLRVWAAGPGKRIAITTGERVVRRLQRNLTSRRLLSFPHLLALFWFFVLLYGERWVFNSKVSSCDWDHWEKWVCSECRM